jgi:uncharacterized protein (TIGR00369 family)
MALVAVELGRAVFNGYPGHRHLNVNGVVHGGYAALLLDSAMGCAIQSVLASGIRVATVSLEIKLVRQLTTEMEVVVAEGRVVHHGRSQATADGRLIQVDTDDVLAHGMTTCLLY